MMSVEGIILAAGLSKRAGSYKLALEIEGKSIIEKCIEGMYDVCSKIIVVGGYKFETISTILKKYEKVNVIYNSNYESGMFSSVKAGLRHIEGEKFFLIPGDYPFVNIETYKGMLSTKGNIIIPAYNGKRGHPVLIESSLISKILNDNTLTNLRDFIRLQNCTTVDVKDKGILIDIDTMEDYIKYNRAVLYET